MENMQNNQKQSEAEIALEVHLSSLENSILISRIDGSEINAESALYDIGKVRENLKEILSQ